MRERFRAVGYEYCLISEITLAELLFGVHRSADPKKNKEKLDILLIDIRVLAVRDALVRDALDVFAQEKARLFNAGRPLPDFDLLIGATAIHHDLTLVTNNTKHFQRLEGIRLEDWSV